MKELLRAILTVSALSLVLFFGVGLSVTYAQTGTAPTTTTPTDAVSQFASKVSILLTKDKARIPNVGFGSSINFTYEGLACFRSTSELSRGGTATYAISCTQQQPKLTARCEDTTGLLNTCRVTDATGNPVQVGGEDTFSPNRVGEDAVIDASTGQQVGEETGKPISDDASCSGNFLCAIGKLPGLLFAGLGFLLLNLSAFILGIAGTVFNWVVIRTVFQFALYFGTSAGMLVAWGVLRDIANIALLFGFIFVGIATILNTQSVEGYTAKKALPRLIIFAVLLNFSLFATQAIIDVANGFSSVFAAYAGQQCDTTTSTAGGTSGQDQATCANIGISSKILEAAGMHQMFPKDWSGLQQAWQAPYTYTVMMIMLSLMVTVTAMVLIAATIMLVVRVVVLSLLMVTSPIGFAGMAIPSLNKIAQDWWHKLINQAFFAPLFLLMIFVSLKLVEGLQSGEATIADAILGNTGSGGNTTAGNMQVVMVFMIVIGFMIGALMIAQKMGAYGASFATKTAGGIAFGAHGFVARRTVGRLSNHLASKVAGSQWARNNPGLGRLTYGALNKGATASFSARNLAGGLVKGAGLDIGKANKDAAHGYHGMEEKSVKQRTEFAKKLTLTTQDKKEIRSSEEEAEDTRRQIREENEHQEAVQENFKRDEQTQKDADAPALNIARDELKKLAEAVKVTRATGTDAEKALAETQYNNDLKAFENMQKAAEERLAIIRNQAAAEKKKHDELVGKLKEYETAQTDNAKWTAKQPQRQYAKNIEHSGLPFPTLDSHANHVAAAKILKDLDKSDNQRMQEALDSFNKKTQDGGAPAAAPSSAPRGGGGGTPSH